jgi:cobalt-zinc-cadmium resistance protein CzcA
LQSVVTDIQKIVDTEIKLPTAVEYGGQFENLQSAKARLMIAVPLALFFILLYFAWIKGSGLPAIPLSAVEVCYLWMRGLPFSILGRSRGFTVWYRSSKWNSVD